MRKIPPADRIGECYGCYQVVSHVHSNVYRVRCTQCGTQYQRNHDALRAARSNETMKCAACRSYISRGTASSSADPDAPRDIGIEWIPGEGFRNTDLGKLQQAFILGKPLS
jgi:hypothetical protein